MKEGLPRGRETGLPPICSPHGLAQSQGLLNGERKTAGWLDLQQENMSWDDILTKRKNTKEVVAAGVSVQGGKTAWLVLGGSGGGSG